MVLLDTYSTWLSRKTLSRAPFIKSNENLKIFVFKRKPLIEEKQVATFHDSCLNCVSSNYLKEFLGFQGSFVLPKGKGFIF